MVQCCIRRIVEEHDSLPVHVSDCIHKKSYCCLVTLCTYRSSVLLTVLYL